MLSFLVNWLRALFFIKKNGIEFGRQLIVVDGHGAQITPPIYMGRQCKIYAGGGVEIGQGAIFSDEVVVLTTMHDFHDEDYIPYGPKNIKKPVVIGEACWIGYRSMILPGVVLGKGVIVGAGSVVTRSFPDGSIVAGNPAKIIGQRDSSNLCKNKKTVYLVEKIKKGRGA
ncbi:MAG: acetyltransferase [Alcanivorax sp.]|nr:MAG: acetyltransferase [Alcanivorax sp.]